MNYFFFIILFFFFFTWLTSYIWVYYIHSQQGSRCVRGWAEARSETAACGWCGASQFSGWVRLAYEDIKVLYVVSRENNQCCAAEPNSSSTRRGNRTLNLAKCVVGAHTCVHVYTCTYHLIDGFHCILMCYGRMVDMRPEVMLYVMVYVISMHIICTTNWHLQEYDLYMRFIIYTTCSVYNRAVLNILKLQCFINIDKKGGTRA